MRTRLDSIIEWIVADGTAIANTTDETQIFPLLSFIIPANFMNHHGMIGFDLYGKLSTTGTPTTTFSARWGGIAGTVLGVSEALTNGSGVTNVQWRFQGLITSRSHGSSGTMLLSGKAEIHTAAGTIISSLIGASGYDAPAVVTVDHTASADLVFTADWSAASASNTLTGMAGRVWGMN
jgi:hypothetical protein